MKSRINFERILLKILPQQLKNKLSDETYLKLRYKSRMGKRLDIKVPKTFNEKLQWLKLYDRKPEYTMMADKYLVREYISEKMGDDHLIPLLGAWDGPDDIDFNSLPDKFVLKCNHNSGLGMYICKDKSQMDIEKVKLDLRRGLAQDYYLLGREWPYKNISRRIIAEQYMVDEAGKELKDYKIFCFNGIPKIILVCADRFSNGGLHENFYDTDWNLLLVQRPKHPNTKYKINKPENLPEMIELAKTLSKDIPFSRIDFYVINMKIYFGEITFFPASGMEEFSPEVWDFKMGEWITLPERIID